MRILLCTVLLFPFFANADVTAEQAQVIACRASITAKPVVFQDVCDRPFRASELDTTAYWGFRGYDINHECLIYVRVYRVDGHPTVRTQCR